MFRFLLWRLFGLCSTLVAVGLLAWLLDGGPGRVLRGTAHRRRDFSPPEAGHVLGGAARAIASGVPAVLGLLPWRPALAGLGALAVLSLLRLKARFFLNLNPNPNLHQEHEGVVNDRPTTPRNTRRQAERL